VFIPALSDSHADEVLRRVLRRDGASRRYIFYSRFCWPAFFATGGESYLGVQMGEAL